MQKFSKINKAYRYLLTFIDIFSKFAFVIPFKDKKGITIKMLYIEFKKKENLNFYELIMVKNFIIIK